jgi:hypothetical protein
MMNNGFTDVSKFEVSQKSKSSLAINLTDSAKKRGSFNVSKPQSFEVSPTVHTIP